MNNIDHLLVHTMQGEAGELRHQSQYVFSYGATDKRCALGLSLPLSLKTYSAKNLPGVMRQNLPEGFLKGRQHQLPGANGNPDDFHLLALTGRHAIGRLSITASGGLPEVASGGEDLEELLAWNGTEELFESLLENYAASSGICGEQPKVLISEKPVRQTVGDEKVLKNRSLIVKAADKDHPGLAENEFHCMSIARQAGLTVPDFWLSDDKGLFIVNRFDRLAPDEWLGFEDMAALTGRQNEEKYSGSYEMIAKAIECFASPRFIASSLEEFFKSVVLSIVLRNGDAHLKNFGLLYSDPTADDTRLSPQFDIVNTTSYRPDDLLALDLGHSKVWANRKKLLEFGKNVCRVDKSNEIIDLIVDTAAGYTPAIEAGDIWYMMQQEIDLGCLSFT